jgi:polar amino acid transport system substrate-binding protein
MKTIQTQKISRRAFLAASGLTALSAAALLTGCGASSGTAASTSASSDSDWAYISGKGTLVIGITVYDPMNYYDADGNLVGFDTEMAEAVCAKLGVEPVFQEIEWDNKVLELNGKSIDCIWNGMTVTDELGQSIDFSISYSENVQVCVVNQANSGVYTDIASINAAGVTIGAEAGSAGEDAATENFPNATLVSTAAQRDCFMELKSGTIDVAVLDRTLADSATGEGTSYTDLVTVPDLELTHEEFAIGLRKGSDVTDKINAALQELAADGTVAAIAEKYPSVAVTL